MGCWGLLGLSLITIVDHSPPTFRTSKSCLNLEQITKLRRVLNVLFVMFVFRMELRGERLRTERPRTDLPRADEAPDDSVLSERQV